MNMVLWLVQRWRSFVAGINMAGDGDCGSVAVAGTNMVFICQPVSGIKMVFMFS